MSTTVRFSVDDKVGTIELDNFAKRNALGAATVQEMLQALREFEAQGVRAVVLRTADFHDVWSAGHDIDELPVRGVDPLPFADPLEELLRAVRGYPGAVIAMVHGTVWGGACDLVLNCDLVVGDQAAAFAVTPARLGLPYSASGIQYFLARLPLNVVNELMMTADLIPAERAYAVGILNHLVSEEMLLDCAYALARKVRSRSGDSIRAYKLQATTFVRAVALVCSGLPVDQPAAPRRLLGRRLRGGHQCLPGEAPARFRLAVFPGASPQARDLACRLGVTACSREVHQRAPTVVGVSIRSAPQSLRRGEDHAGGTSSGCDHDERDPTRHRVHRGW